MKNNEEKDISELANPEDLWKELTSGNIKMLLLSTVLAVVNAGLLVYMFFDDGEQEMFFPVRLKGNIVWIILSLTLLIWTGLAIFNWKSRFFNKQKS